MLVKPVPLASTRNDPSWSGNPKRGKRACGGTWTGPGRENAAVTASSPSTAIAQAVLLPVHAPVQPSKEAPASGIAWSCNFVPFATSSVQLPRQSSPVPRTSPSPEVVTRRETKVPPPEPLSGGPGLPQAVRTVAAETAVIDARARKP